MNGDLKDKTPAREFPEGNAGQAFTPDRLLITILITPVLLTIGTVLLYAARGSQHATLEIPWFTPLFSTFVALTALTVAFLAFGRFHVLGDSVSYWIGLAFASFGIGLIFYVLAWPGLLPGERSFIASLPNTAGWMSPLAVSIPGLLLLAAGLFSWPQKEALKGSRVDVSILIWLGLIVLGFLLLVVFERSLPVLVRNDGSFTRPLIIWNVAVILIYVAGLVLSIRRYGQRRDRLIGYVAFFQIALVFSPVLTILGGRRYDMWWYMGRVVLVIGCLVVLFGLLADYVRLFRQVQDSEMRYRQLTASLQDALAKAEAGSLMFDAILQNIPIGMAVTGGPPDFPLANVSRYGLEMSRRPAETLVGAPAGHHQESWNILLPDGVTRPLPEQMPLYRASRQGEFIQNMELVMESSDGRKIPVLINAAPVRDGQGNIVAAINTWLDISERKQAEEALHWSEQKFEAIFQSAPFSIILARLSDGVISEVNAAWEELFEVPRAEALGRTSVELGTIPDPETRQRGYTEMREQGRLRNFEMKFRAKSGREFISSNNAEIITFAGTQYLLSTTEDITERKQAEKALAEYARDLERSNRDLQAFAFMASHDLQEPLRKIEAFGDLLLEKSETMNNAQRELLARIRSSARRMRSMVDGLLQLSRVDTHAQPFQTVRLNRIIEDVLADLELSIRQTHAVIDVCDLPEIEADPLQMHQLFQNLIGNALKFQPPGNQPRINICQEQPEPGFIRILVADNGIGFNEDHAGHLFEPFKRLVSRAQYEGSGMGLAICRKLVERHRGSILARSRPGQGTTLLITLPIHQNVSIENTERKKQE